MLHKIEQVWNIGLFSRTRWKTVATYWWIFLRNIVRTWMCIRSCKDTNRGSLLFPPEKPTGHLLSMVFSGYWFIRWSLLPVIGPQRPIARCPLNFSVGCRDKLSVIGDARIFVGCCKSVGDSTDRSRNFPILDVASKFMGKNLVYGSYGLFTVFYTKNTIIVERAFSIFIF